MPDISLPDIKLPDVKFRDGRLRDLKMPDIDLRERLPDVDLTKVALPEALREMSMPEVSMRDIHMPDMHLRDLKAPKVDLRDLDMGRWDPRRIDFSGVDTKRLRELAPFGRPAPKPASPLPWVLVAAVGGLFAGWWLATSSVAAPRLRALFDGLRTRMDAWRAARAGWQDDRDEALDISDQPAADRSGGTWTGISTHDTAPWDAPMPASMGHAESGREPGAASDDAGLGGTAYEPAGARERESATS